MSNNEWLQDVFLEAVRLSRVSPPGSKLPSWFRWNEIMKGFPLNQYSIICGPSGFGKTTMLANLSVQLLYAGVQHFVMEIETGRHDYAIRLASAFAEKDLSQFDPVPEKVWADFASHPAYKYFDKHHGKLRLSKYETRVPVEKLMQDIASEVKQFGTQVVFIDNLNFLLEVKKAQDAIVEMDRVTHTLIEFVKSTPVHIVMVMHPRKTDQRRVHSEYDIKGSLTAIQEAHNVLLFNRPNEDLVEEGKAHEWNDREITFAKLRKNGRFEGCRLLFGCQDSVSYVEKGRYGRFISKRSD